jgi:glycosyltransferase involved in cell wall biosynthesis
MEIIFINQDSGQLFGDIVNAFSRAGYSCTLLSTAKYNIRLEPGVNFVECETYDRTTTLKRLWTWLKYTKQVYTYIKRHKGEELFIVSNPPLAMFIPLLLKRVYSLLIYDIYPDAIVSVGLLSESNLLIKWWKKKNRRIYAGAKAIYTLSKNMAKSMGQYCDVNKIKVIPNWADTSMMKPIMHIDNPFLKEQQLQDKFIVLYSGNMGMTHRIESIVEVATLLKEEKGIFFLIIGMGAKKPIIENMVNERKLNNCMVLPYLPLEQTPYSIGAADVGVITLDENSADVSVPSKTYNMLAVGSALLCITPQSTELSELVKEHNVGKSFRSAEIEKMRDYILELYNDPQLLKLYKDNSREASTFFTPQNAEIYVEHYASVSNC